MKKVEPIPIENHMSGNSIPDRITFYIGRISSWLCIALVITQFTVVLARYIYDSGSVMFQESILYIFGTMFMLALADTLRSDRHVRVDMLYNFFPERLRYKVDAFGMILFALPLCCFLLWVSWGYVVSSWEALEGSREATGLPGVYLFKSVILVSIVLLLIQACTIIVRSILLLFKDTKDD